MLQFMGLQRVSHNLVTEKQQYSQLLVLFLLTVKSFSIFGCKEYNQSDFGTDHLMMSMCRVFSCVLEEGVFYDQCVLLPKLC